MKSFYVIYQDFNRRTFKPYDIMPYLVEQYNNSENKPSTREEFIEFIKSESMHQWWARCEYEIVIAGWPNTKTYKKWDIHKQVLMNIEIITDTLINNVNENKSSC